MRRIFFTAGLLAFAALAGHVRAEDRRTDQSRVAIMTFNAEFLWDGKQPEEGSADFPWKGSVDEAEEHMQKVADVIKQADPDILNLVEVENIDALNTLNEKFLAGRGYRAYLENGKDTSTGQDVALLTRIDPEGNHIERTENVGVSGSVSKSVSKNYFAKFDVGGVKFALIGIHLLARPLDQSRKDQRQAQAKAIEALALSLAQSGFQPIILGDFNDYDGDPASADHQDNLPISNVLTTLKQMGTPTDGSDDRVSIAVRVPKAERYTSFFDRNENGGIEPTTELTSIDHILIPPSFVGKIVQVDFPHLLDPREVSDHFPLVLTLATGPGDGAGGAAASLRIFSALPNPAGDEHQNEEVTLRNPTAVSVGLANWKLRDLAGTTWTLSGTVPANDDLTIHRNGQAMSLNNHGDTIDLVAPNGQVAHTVSYGHADEGEVFQFAQ